MISHIVFIRLKDYAPREKENILTALKTMLDKLSWKIDVIVSLETGINFNERPSAYDLALVVKLRTEEDIEIYRSHPEHIKVLDYMKTLRLETGVVDFFTPAAGGD